MDERGELLRAVWESPWDEAPKRTFADWLEQRGEPEAASRLRRCLDLWCFLDDLPESDEAIDPAEVRDACERLDGLPEQDSFFRIVAVKCCLRPWVWDRMDAPRRRGIEIAWLHACGLATDEELDQAREHARVAHVADLETTPEGFHTSAPESVAAFGVTAPSGEEALGHAMTSSMTAIERTDPSTPNREWGYLAALVARVVEFNSAPSTSPGER